MKILIVDDSAFVRNITKKTLTANFPGAEIIESSHGREALEKCREHKPEWLISDLLMPEMTGQELIAALRREAADIRVVVVSADIQNATREEMFALSIEEFINKPLTGDKLTRLVEVLRG